MTATEPRRLTIYPTWQKLEEAVARLVSEPGARAVAGFGIMTLETFEQRLSTQLLGPRKTASWLARSLALAKALDEIYGGGRGFFADARGFKGFIPVMLSFFDELGAGLVSPDTLKGVKGYATGAEAEIARLYSLYSSKLHDKGLADSGDARMELVEAIGRAECFKTPLLRNVSSITLRDVYQFTPYRFELFRRLALAIPVKIVAPAPDNRRKAFGYVIANIEKFENLGESAGNLEIEFEEPVEGPLKKLRDRIFEMEAPDESENLDELSGRVKILKCQSRYREVEETGLAILKLRAETGAEWNKFCVVFRDIAPYGAIIDGVFRRYSIPFYFRRGLALSSNPLVCAALSLFKTIDGGFAREDVAQVITSPYFHRFTKLDTDIAQKLFIKSGIVDGPPKLWKMKLDSGLKRIEKSEADSALAVIKETLSLLSELEDFGRQNHPGAFFKTFAELLRSLDIRAEPQAGTPKFETVHFRDNNALGQLWETVEEAEEAVEELGQGHFNMGYAALRSLFISRLSSRDIPEPKGADTNKVPVLNAHDAAGLQFPHLFICGLVEGEFPRFPETGSVLNEAQRENFNKVFGEKLKNEAPHVYKGRRVFDRWQEKWQEESLLFFQSIKAAGESLTLTFPEKELNGRPLLRSQFIDDALDVVAGGMNTVEREKLLQGSAPPPLVTDREIATLADPEEVNTRLLKEVFRPQSGAGAIALPDLPGVRGEKWLARFESLTRLAEMERRRDDYFFETARERKLALLSRHNGDLSANAGEIERLIANYYGGAYSPTYLEQYGQCPFRFFAARLLGLKPDELPDVEMAPMQMGTLLHSILENFYVELIAEKRLPVKDTKDYFSELSSTAAKVFAETEEEGTQGDQSIFNVEKKRILSQLRLWIAGEAEDQERNGYLPTAVELNFGKSRRGGKSQPPMPIALEPGVTRYISGQIDRIDISLAEKGVRVVDYKNSSNGYKYGKLTKRENMGATSFQPPMYMILAKHYVESAGIIEKVEKVSAGYRLLKPMKSGKGYILTDSGKRDKEVVDDGVFLSLDDPADAGFIGLLKVVMKNIESGWFPVDPDNCEFCDFPALCRLIRSYAPIDEEDI